MRNTLNHFSLSLNNFAPKIIFKNTLELLSCITGLNGLNYNQKDNARHF